MISFKQFLAERETSGVYVNQNGKLTLIADLIKDEFGLKFTGLYGGCLATQMLYSIESVTGVKAQNLVNAAGAELQGPFSGVTLQRLFDIYNGKQLKLPKGKTLTLQLSSHVYNAKQALDEVKAGQPVVLVASASTDFDGDSNGFIKLKFKMTPGNLHALLIVGYDEDEKAFIVREARHGYGFKGYGKILTTDIWEDTARLLGIHVDSFKLEDTPKKDKKK